MRSVEMASLPELTASIDTCLVQPAPSNRFPLPSQQHRQKRSCRPVRRVGTEWGPRERSRCEQYSEERVAAVRRAADRSQRQVPRYLSATKDAWTNWKVCARGRQPLLIIWMAGAEQEHLQSPETLY